ncbi:MAG: enoyl-CoA hydratase [Pseudomonadota bacterium]
MFNTDTASRLAPKLLAAAFSVVLSIGTFAYAIVPATPSLA